ncbi:MAG TPA: ClpXP protease specificity-enhancing factor [Burkholderiales bacterium]|nr:ClpXP protease specificity-enhancing factor [Burkholderiales bacterium]
MPRERSTKPYLIRAIYEWCTDSGLTPYLSVQVDANTRVPAEYVKNGEIVLNVSADATHRLTLGNDLVQFAARFNGVSRELSIPVGAIKAIFARENGQGLFFQPQSNAPGEVSAPILTIGTPQDPSPPAAPNGNGKASGNGKKPKLQVIK